jgi:hypothetical protein
MKIVKAISYYLSALLMFAGVINFFVSFQNYFSSNSLIAVSIILPIVIDYTSVTGRGYIELWLNIFILICGFLIIMEYNWAFILFLILKSILFAKQGGLILKKYNNGKLSW